MIRESCNLGSGSVFVRTLLSIGPTNDLATYLHPHQVALSLKLLRLEESREAGMVRPVIAHARASKHDPGAFFSAAILFVPTDTALITKVMHSVRDIQLGGEARFALHLTTELHLPLNMPRNS